MKKGKGIKMTEIRRRYRASVDKAITEMGFKRMPRKMKIRIFERERRRD